MKEEGRESSAQRRTTAREAEEKPKKRLGVFAFQKQVGLRATGCTCDTLRSGGENFHQ
jgi:hypothetical protein